MRLTWPLDQYSRRSLDIVLLLHSFSRCARPSPLHFPYSVTMQHPHLPTYSMYVPCIITPYQSLFPFFVRLGLAFFPYGSFSDSCISLTSLVTVVPCVPHSNSICSSAHPWGFPAEPQSHVYSLLYLYPLGIFYTTNHSPRPSMGGSPPRPQSRVYHDTPSHRAFRSVKRWVELSRDPLITGMSAHPAAMRRGR